MKTFSRHRQRSVYSARACQTGTRIEETARLADLIENSIRQVIPAQELDNILDNIGLPYSTINYLHNTSGLIAAARCGYPGFPEGGSSADG